MTKELTTMQARQIANTVNGLWDGSKNDIKLRGHSVMSMLQLKKRLETEAELIQDAITQHAEAIGGTWQDGGGLKIPEDKITEMNEWLMEFGKEIRFIEYSPIMMGPNDTIPVAIMEQFMDFIVMED